MADSMKERRTILKSIGEIRLMIGTHGDDEIRGA
jgi:hypothetical protein